MYYSEASERLTDWNWGGLTPCVYLEYKQLTSTFIYCSQQNYEVSIIISLQMKLRLRKIKQLAQDQRAKI